MALIRDQVVRGIGASLQSQIYVACHQLVLPRITGKPADIGKFRTPSLRNVAVTAPYMHDGSIATLEEAVEHELYYRLQSGKQILLTSSEKVDLIEFLKSLTDDRVRRADKQ